LNRKILLYSVFDDEFGPMPAFYLPNEADEELVMNLAVQSLTSSFFGDYDKEHEGKAIIALSIVDMVMFIYYFVIPSSQARGGTRPASISILVEKDEENLLYDNSAYLENRIKQIIPALRSSDPSVSTVELMRLYQDIKKIDQNLQKPIERLPIKSLLKMMKKENFAKLLHCLICNLPIVFIGKDPKSMMTIANSVTPLIPHKILIIESISNLPDKLPPFDILMIEEQNWEKAVTFFKSLKIIPSYYMDDDKFENLKGDLLFVNILLKRIKKMKTENEIETFIRLTILKMVKKSEQLQKILEETENKIDLELVLEKLEMNSKFFETLLFLLGDKRKYLQNKIVTKEKRLKKFLESN